MLRNPPAGLTFVDGVLSGTPTAPFSDTPLVVSVSYKEKETTKVYILPEITDYSSSTFKDLAAVSSSVEIKSSENYKLLRQSIGSYYRYIRSSSAIYRTKGTTTLKSLGTIEATIVPQQKLVNGVYVENKYSPSNYTWTAISKNAPCLNSSGLVDAIAIHTCGYRNGYIFGMDTSGELSIPYANAPYLYAPYYVSGTISAVSALKPEFSAE